MPKLDLSSAQRIMHSSGEVQQLKGVGFSWAKPALVTPATIALISTFQETSANSRNFDIALESGKEYIVVIASSQGDSGPTNSNYLTVDVTNATATILGQNQNNTYESHIWVRVNGAATGTQTLSFTNTGKNFRYTAVCYEVSNVDFSAGADITYTLTTETANSDWPSPRTFPLDTTAHEGGIAISAHQGQEGSGILVSGLTSNSMAPNNYKSNFWAAHMYQGDLPAAGKTISHDRNGGISSRQFVSYLLLKSN